jgi:hypothetical protein
MISSSLKFCKHCERLAPNVCGNNAVCFAAIEQRAEGRYQKTDFSRPKAHTNTRQNEWSDHNYFFP